MNFNIALLRGDGIGPEIVDSAVAVLHKIGEKYGHTFTCTPYLIGGCAIDATGIPLPKETIDGCLASDSVLLGAVGGAVGQNIAGSMNNIMQGINQPVQSGITPPPIPTSVYNVAVNGQATGPFDINILKQMAIAGQFKASSLVWKPGMESWLRADSVDELKNLFKNVMPPIPTTED